MKNIDFFDFFSFIFCIVEIDYFFNGLPIYERFQIGFLTKDMYQKSIKGVIGS